MACFMQLDKLVRLTFCSNEVGLTLDHLLLQDLGLLAAPFWKKGWRLNWGSLHHLHLRFVIQEVLEKGILLLISPEGFLIHSDTQNNKGSGGNGINMCILITCSFLTPSRDYTCFELCKFGSWSCNMLLASLTCLYCHIQDSHPHCIHA